MKIEDQRRIMVEEQLQGRDITDERVLDAFRTVPRHEFVSEELQHFAYHDNPLGIGAGQTISQPYMVAKMLQLMCIQPTDAVLEIGTGSGYQTALLAELALQVYTIERVRSLGEEARRRLRRLKYDNISLKIGDGTYGWRETFSAAKGFDKIVIAAGAPHLPEMLLSQLNDPGIMVLPQGDKLQQTLLMVEKRDGELVETTHGMCNFVPLIGDDAWKN